MPICKDISSQSLICLICGERTCEDCVKSHALAKNHQMGAHKPRKPLYCHPLFGVEENADPR